MPHKVVKEILKAKMEDIPFVVIPNAIKNVPNEEIFNKFFLDNKILDCRPTLQEEDYKIFGDWGKLEEELKKMYGNVNTSYTTLMRTVEKDANKVWASLHNDRADVLHLNCYGTVTWLLIDNEDPEMKEHFVTLNPGDALYFRGWTLHETTPHSARGSIIFMNLPHEKIPDGLDFSTQRKDVIRVLKERLTK